MLSVKHRLLTSHSKLQYGSLTLVESPTADNADHKVPQFCHFGNMAIFKHFTARLSNNSVILVCLYQFQMVCELGAIFKGDASLPQKI